MKSKLILVGGGSHCNSCIDVIEQCDNFEIVGILDSKKCLGEDLLGYKIIGRDDDIHNLAQQDYQFLVTVGQIGIHELRKNIFNKLRNANARIATVVSPRAYVSKHANIGLGSIIMHDALVNARVNVGVNCIINSKALIEHDTVIKSHCHISTSAVLNGQTMIGEGSFLGSNAVCVEGMVIPPKSFIKANSLFKGQQK